VFPEEREEMPKQVWMQYEKDIESYLRDGNALTRAIANRDIFPEPIPRNSWSKMMKRVKKQSQVMIVETVQKCPVSQRQSACFTIEGLDAQLLLNQSLYSWANGRARCLRFILKNVTAQSPDEATTLTVLAKSLGIEDFPSDIAGRREVFELLNDREQGFGWNARKEFDWEQPIGMNSQTLIWRSA